MDAMTHLRSHRGWIGLGLLVLLPSGLLAQAGGVSTPKNDYVITIHYDLGMHCTGFDLSYCCVLPPYNSILAQVVKTAERDGLPKLLTGDDLKANGWVLWYEHDRNTYSEGPKMLYWNVPYDVDRNGSLQDPVDSFANGQFVQLRTYAENFLGYKLIDTDDVRVIGLDVNIPNDHGPTGKPMSFSTLDYTGNYGTIVYAKLNDGQSEVPIPLSMRHYFEALGLPLTPFFDGSTGHIRAITEEVIRPYQIARVTLAAWKDRDGDGRAQGDEVEPVRHRDGRPVTFTGTNPIDVPGCDRCHGTAEANGTEFELYRPEREFWKRTFPNTSDYYALVKAASISVLEVHDRRSGTDFLKNYNPKDRTGASVTRLGRPSVKCQECHPDNVIGVLEAARDPRTGKPVSPLTRAMHLKHLNVRPQGDAHGRPANCQTCHPAHSQSGSLDRYPLDMDGKFRGGEKGDIRDFYGGCFIGRDVHSNPRYKEEVSPASHLNAVGRWMKETVMKDGKGLYCTNCHTLGSRLLYKADLLDDAVDQTGRTLRDKDLKQILAVFRRMEAGRYADYTVEDFFDPKVAPYNRVLDVWTDSTNAPYNIVDDAGDYWLSAGEPHCADCHAAPFVEGMGGTYFPIDQEGKYALMRYSKGHHGISCQSCHESTHGLYPVAPGGPDPTTWDQAAQLNPDGSHGPLKCGTCHAVDAEGVPVKLTPDKLTAFSDAEYPTRYEKAVAYAHTARIPRERVAGLREE
jgi:hypothetical protein